MFLSVQVDEKMQVLTKEGGELVPNLYCIGDANGKLMLAHAASAHGVRCATRYTFIGCISIFTAGFDCSRWGCPTRHIHIYIYISAYIYIYTKYTYFYPLCCVCDASPACMDWLVRFFFVVLDGAFFPPGVRRKA